MKRLNGAEHLVAPFTGASNWLNYWFVSDPIGVKNNTQQHGTNHDERRSRLSGQALGGHSDL